MLYGAFTLALGQDRLMLSKSLKYEIVDSFWFYLTAKRESLSTVMYYMPPSIQGNEHF